MNLLDITMSWRIYCCLNIILDAYFFFCVICLQSMSKIKYGQGTYGSGFAEFASKKKRSGCASAGYNDGFAQVRLT